MKEKETPVMLAADIIIEYKDGSIALVKRKNPPFKGQWSLPGGKLDGNETIEQTAIREAKEETGLDIKLTGILGVYSKPGRDPRGRYVSVVFRAEVLGGEPLAGDDAEAFITTRNYLNYALAFDHNSILTDYIRQKSQLPNFGTASQ